MQLPRRTFIKTGTLTAVSAGLALSAARSTFSQNPRSRGTDYEIPLKAQEAATFSFTRGTFEPYVGDIFQAPNALGRKVSLTLLDVKAYKTKDDTKLTTKTPRETDSFSLTFSATERLPRFTSIHKVSHPALGEFDLFLSPRETKNGKLFYEAVFNRTL